MSLTEVALCPLNMVGYVHVKLGITTIVLLYFMCIYFC